MKSLEELKDLRDKVSDKIKKEQEGQNYRILVGMATCGIAAGAGPVMSAIEEAVEKDKLNNVTLTMTGCIGICRLEPIIEVFCNSGERYTYVKMDAEKAKKVIEQHIKKGNPVMEYSIGAE